MHMVELRGLSALPSTLGEVPDDLLAQAWAATTKLVEGDQESLPKIYLHADLEGTQILRRMVLLHETLNVSLKRDFVRRNPHREAHMVEDSGSRAEHFLEMASAATQDKIYRLAPFRVVITELIEMPPSPTRRAMMEDYIGRHFACLDKLIVSVGIHGKETDLFLFLDWLHRIQGRAEAPCPPL